MTKKNIPRYESFPVNICRVETLLRPLHCIIHVMQEVQ